MFQQIAEGDEIAFRNLFDVYTPFLYPAINKIVKDNQAADDVIQETFLRIWLYRDKLPFIDSPRSWVLRIKISGKFKVIYNADVLQ